MPGPSSTLHPGGNPAEAPMHGTLRPSLPGAWHSAPPDFKQGTSSSAGSQVYQLGARRQERAMPRHLLPAFVLHHLSLLVALSDTSRPMN